MAAAGRDDAQQGVAGPGRREQRVDSERAADVELEAQVSRRAGQALEMALRANGTPS